MAFYKSDVNKPHPNKRVIEKIRYDRGKPVVTKITPMLCVEGEDLGVIAKIPFCNKDGYFLIVVNKNDEIFTLESWEIDFNVDIPFELKFRNKSPKFIDFLEVESFSLDSL